jgi:DNA-binding transcriptional MerR regulator
MFRTGEFSQLARVSKRLLQFYDEIGLLKPARIDSNTGYRYYSARQLPQLNRILALKDLGFSLDQIIQLSKSEISDEEIRGMLLLKRAQVEQTVREEQERLRRIQARLELNRFSDESTEVVIKSIPPQPFLGLRASIPTPQEMFQLLHLLQQVVPAKLNQQILGSLAVVVHTDEFRLEDNDIEMGYLLKKSRQGSFELSNKYVLAIKELPPVATMATAVQVGGPDLVFMALGKIGSWIEQNGYRIAGPYREIGLELPASGLLNEMTIEVQIPVESSNVSLPDM